MRANAFQIVMSRVLTLLAETRDNRRMTYPSENIVYRFSVRRYSDSNDREGMSVGVFQTLGEAQRYLERAVEIASALGSPARFKVWQV